MLIALQVRHRLVRESLAESLLEQPDVDRVQSVTTSAELFNACADLRPQAAVVELNENERERDILVARALVRCHPSLQLVGIADRVRPDLEKRLERAGFDGIVTQGQGESAVVGAVRAATRRPAAHRVHRSMSPLVLTSREIEVLDLVAAGCTTAETAERLHLQAKTIENHRQRIFSKLGVQNQAHAVETAMQWGLLRPMSEVDY